MICAHERRSLPSRSSSVIGDRCASDVEGRHALIGIMWVTFGHLLASSVPATMGLAGFPTVQGNEVGSGRPAVADPR